MQGELKDEKPFGTAKGERRAARRARVLRGAQSRECTAEEESNESARWEAFYGRGQGRTYRDRHLLRGEFPELVSALHAAAPRIHAAPLGDDDEDAKRDLVLLELGCGTGSAIYPLLRANDRLFAVGVDFSNNAINILRAQPEYNPSRVCAVVGDITTNQPYRDAVINHGIIPGAKYVTAFWTLSAMCAHDVEATIRALSEDNIVTNDALFCIRDFALDDMREQRFKSRAEAVEKSQLGNLYRRGDGTMAMFFNAFELSKLVQRFGWIQIRCQVVHRDVQNRAKNVVMNRRWVQAVFKRSSVNTSSSSLQLPHVIQEQSS